MFSMDPFVEAHLGSWGPVAGLGDSRHKGPIARKSRSSRSTKAGTPAPSARRRVASRNSSRCDWTTSKSGLAVGERGTEVQEPPYREVAASSRPWMRITEAAVPGPARSTNLRHAGAVPVACAFRLRDHRQGSALARYLPLAAKRVASLTGRENREHQKIQLVLPNWSSFYEVPAFTK